MINEYVFEWDLSNKINHQQDLNIIRGMIFQEAVNCAFFTFDFKIEGVLNHTDNTSFDEFVNQTDWLRYIQDRTFNFIYTYNIKNLDLIVVDQHKAIGIKMKEKYLYCIPYWMAYKFTSSEEEYKQEIISVGILTPQRPKLKKTKKLW